MMKKLFAILVAALLVVACGGGNTTKEESKSIEDKFSEYLTKMEKAVNADDYERAIDVYLAYEDWVDSLDDEQLEELNKIMEEMNAERLYILDDVGSSYYEGGEPEVIMVYSNCYDGYLNVRAEPSSKSQIVGRLCNGPEGAELLGVEGAWTQVRVNDIVGYIWSADTQSYPSDPVYIDASVVVGEWVWCDEYAHFDSCTIESNGDFYMSGYLSMDTSGTWHLSGHNIVLEHNDGKTTVCSVNNRTLVINGHEYSAE